MRIGVTGAGGYVGRAALRRLAERGHTLAGLVRNGTPPETPGAQWVRGDVRDPAALRQLAAGADAIVHAAAYVHRAADSPQARAECFAINVGATHALIEAMASTGRKPHLVFVSSTAVYGPTFHEATEADTPRPVTAYGKSKLAAELAVRDAARSGAITACVLRPAVVYGPAAPGNTVRLAGLIRRGWVPRVGGGANRKSMVHVDDLAEAIARSVEAPDGSNGRTFNVAGEAVAVRDMVEAIAAGIGARPRWVLVPGWLAAGVGGASWAATWLSRGTLPDLSRLVEAFVGEATVDTRLITTHLGLTFRPTGPGITDTSAPR